MSRRFRRCTGPLAVALALVMVQGCLGLDRYEPSGKSTDNHSIPKKVPTQSRQNDNEGPEVGSPSSVGANGAVLVGAGDIADCGTKGDEATAKLLDDTSGVVFTLGDNAYPSGTASEFSDCYDPSWGRHKGRTYPSVGNNEYETAGASGYFGYFGTKAGDAGKGYYSYEIGSWHVVVLNSNCSEVSCAVGSRQERWLRSDLAANRATCTLAYWHHPLFSAGGNTPEVAPFWEALYAADAEVVINGHVHAYERFIPQRPDGTVDRQSGIREFVVGTGGAGLNPLKYPKANSSAQNTGAHGVLKITLQSANYGWDFVPVAGKTFTDSGSAKCH